MLDNGNISKFFCIIENKLKEIVLQNKKYKKKWDIKIITVPYYIGSKL